MADIRINCVVANNVLAESKEKGTPSVKFQLAYKDAASGAESTLTADLWLTDASVDKTLKTLLDVFGWSGRISSLNDPILKGKPCVAVCEYEEYKGKNYLKVKFINRAGKALEKADKGTVAALEARLAAQCANLEAEARNKGIKFEAEPDTTPSRASAATHGAGAFDSVPATEDDLPF